MPEELLVPAEWQPHAGTWLAWPHRKSDWPGKFGPVRWAFAEIARLLSRHETVFLVIQNAGHAAEARATLKAAGADLAKVEFVQHPTDRGWLRDCGAIFTHQGDEKVALDFQFTGWGKYPDHALDNTLPRTVAAYRKVRRVEPGAVLEGGSIDFDGSGTLLTTEECLLSPVQERNPGWGRDDYETLFRESLGVTKTIWLGNGIAGDDTHGHVDDLARFTSPSTIALMTTSDANDANYIALAENRERLQSVRDAMNRAIEVVALPSPRPVVFKGIRLPASYVNFLIANAQVLVPTFNDSADRVALGVLAELFPDREVIGVHALDLVWGLGTIHCMTQQEPL